MNDERRTRRVENVSDRCMYGFLEDDDLAGSVDAVFVLGDILCAIRIGAKRAVGVRRGGRGLFGHEGLSR